MSSRTCSGTYLQWPIVVLNLGESASLGTWMTISTLLAVERRLNWDFAFTMISTREWAWRSMTDSIQINGLIYVFWGNSNNFRISNISAQEKLVLRTVHIIRDTHGGPGKGGLDKTLELNSWNKLLYCFYSLLWFSLLSLRVCNIRKYAIAMKWPSLIAKKYAKSLASHVCV